MNKYQTKVFNPKAHVSIETLHQSIVWAAVGALLMGLSFHIATILYI